MSIWDELNKHVSETYDTLSNGLVGKRTRGLLNMVEGNVKHGLPMLDKNPQDWNTNDVLNTVMGGTIAGRAANTFNPRTGQIADDMRAAGASRDDIWNATAEATGQPTFFDQGGKGQLKWEIDDSGMSLNQDAVFTPDDSYMNQASGNLLKHGRMKGAYPQVMGDNMYYTFDQNMDSLGNHSKISAYDDKPMEHFIKLRDEAIPGTTKAEKIERYRKGLRDAKGESIEDLKSLYNATTKEARNIKAEDLSTYRQMISDAKDDPFFRPDTKSTALHEVNHAVQDIEGFPKGGNSGMFQDKISDKWNGTIEAERLNQITNSREYYNEIDRNNDMYKEMMGDIHYSSNEFKPMMKKYKEWVAINSPLMNEADAIAKELGKKKFTKYDQYQRLTGEADARAVQKRMDMNMQQRMDKPFYEDYDVPQDEFIYRYGGGGASMSVGDNAAFKTAQRNAALPPEKGGLGLPENNSAMDRANAMGFDTDNIYSHSGGDVKEIKKGGDNNIFDGIFAVNGEASPHHGTNTTQLIARNKKIAGSGDYDIDYDKAMEYIKNEFPGAADDQLDNIYRAVGEDDYNFYDNNPMSDHGYSDPSEAAWNAQRIRGQIASEQGYDAIEMSDEYGTSYLFPAGSKARSVLAAFDPFKKESANLLATGLLGSTALGGLLNGERQQQTTY